MDQTLTQKELDLCASLLSGLREPAVLVGPDGRMKAANAAMGELFPALKRDEILALHLRNPNILQAVQDVLAGGDQREISWHERVPVEQIFDVRIGPVVVDQRRGALMTFYDLTSARRVEKMRSEFIANVSHELRTPLASLLGFVETLQGPAREDAAARMRFLDIMREQARRMSRLIDDLLSLSRVEQNEHLRPTTDVDLCSVVQQICDSLAPIAKDNRVTLALSLPSTAVIKGDRDELVRLAENLIENAIKYGSLPEQDTQVEVTITQLKDQTSFKVRDHGRGIDRQHLPRLTERFYRADAGESRAKGGTGLGLALVKHIAMRHRARLTIASEPGQGSTFEVIF
jgi:two-component system phosphate regulon sensor histidine kinase PhoR